MPIAVQEYAQHDECVTSPLYFIVIQGMKGTVCVLMEIAESVEGDTMDAVCLVALNVFRAIAIVRSKTDLVDPILLRTYFVSKSLMLLLNVTLLVVACVANRLHCPMRLIYFIDYKTTRTSTRDEIISSTK